MQVTIYHNALGFPFGGGHKCLLLVLLLGQSGGNPFYLFFPDSWGIGDFWQLSTSSLAGLNHLLNYLQKCALSLWISMELWYPRPLTFQLIPCNNQYSKSGFILCVCLFSLATLCLADSYVISYLGWFFLVILKMNFVWESVQGFELPTRVEAWSHCASWVATKVKTEFFSGI